MCFQRPYLAASLAVLLIICGISIIFVIPELSLALAKAWSLKLDEDSTSYDYWIISRKPIVSRKFFFNVTNPSEVLAGKKPVLHEVGPYSYVLILRRVNVTFGGKDRVSYNNRYSTEFLRSESVGSDSDLITTLNPELLLALSARDDISDPLADIVRHVYSNDATGGLFVTRSVHDLLFGRPFVMPALSRALNQSQGVTLAGPPSDKLSPRYTVYTGKHDIDDINTLARFNNAEDLPFWNRAECSSIRGTRPDNSFGPPIDDDDVKEIQTLMFNSRKVTWRVTDDDDDVNAYDWEFNTKKLSPAEDTFANVYDNKENDCYESHRTSPEGYTNPNWNNETAGMGLPSGVFDVGLASTPRRGSVLLSFPHFLHGDPYLRSVVSGLSPNPDIHASEMNIEPKTGVTIASSTKIQTNLMLNPSVRGKQFRFSDAPAIIYPILWQQTEYGIARSAAKKLYLVVETSWIIGFSIGPMFALFGGILLFLAVKLIQSERSNLRPPAYPSAHEMTYGKTTQPEDQDWVATSDF